MGDFLKYSPNAFFNLEILLLVEGLGSSYVAGFELAGIAFDVNKSAEGVAGINFCIVSVTFS